MATELKAIDTVYNGYRFRSRLEARWAVFFDAIDLAYQYEAEGFDLGKTGYYLPDFFIPSWDCFIEIKGQEPTYAEQKKAEQLAARSLKKVFILAGDCSNQKPFGNNTIHQFYPLRENDIVSGNLLVAHDTLNFLAECELHHVIGFYLDNPCINPGGHRFSVDGQNLKGAFTAARQARFEHGETPHFSGK